MLKVIVKLNKEMLEEKENELQDNINKKFNLICFNHRIRLEALRHFIV